ncbi:hypothetical protein VTK56DRAFT_1898 [Thermocarpiscus australiensis]
MAPSVVRLGAVALACASGVVAQEAYQLKESYNPSNFFEKFNFFSSPDPNGGFVKYRNQQDSEALGLVKTNQDDVYIGVQNTDFPQDGRSSVRLESVNTYNSGLFIADFTHFPANACGAWPAFWLVGAEWPRDGEVDIYEGWNMNTRNKIVLHTDSPVNTGICTVDQSDFTSPMQYSNCWSNAPGQPGNTGCAVEETNGLWANPSGGVYATEWQEDGIRVWSWSHDQVPADVKSKEPNPDNWGKPSFAALSKTCDVKRSFNNMRMILNINFCGDAAGGLWADTCKTSTNVDECYVYVQWNPDAFKDTYWKVKGIDVYQLEKVKPSSTSTTVSSTRTSSSSTKTSTSITSAATTSTTSAMSTSTTSTLASTTSTSSSAPETSSSSASSELSSSTSSEEATSSTTSSSTEDPTLSTTFTTASTASETDVVTSSSPDATATTPTSSQSYTTSTIYTTTTRTITSCAPTVTNCPGRVVTSVIAIGTTVCPVSETPTPQPTATVTAASSSSSAPNTNNSNGPGGSGGWTTSTVYSTRTYTITSCAATVTNCPGRVTTTLVPIGTTVCPVESGSGSGSHPATASGTIKTFTTVSLSSSSAEVVVPPTPTETETQSETETERPAAPPASSVLVPVPSGGLGSNGTSPGPGKPSVVVPPVVVITTARPGASASGKPPVVVSGGAKVVGSGVLMVLGAALAFVL